MGVYAGLLSVGRTRADTARNLMSRGGLTHTQFRSIVDGRLPWTAPSAIAHRHRFGRTRRQSTPLLLVGNCRVVGRPVMLF